MVDFKKHLKNEGAHAKYSLSGSERWLNCAGSIKAEAEYPEPPENRYAAEGTRAHTLHDKWLKHIIKTSMAFSIPKGFPKGMVDPVRVSINDIKGLRDKHPGAILQSEQRVSLEYIHPEFWGTLDVRLVEHFGTLFVRDYKHGGGVPVDIVDPSSNSIYNHNTQVIGYALASAHEFNYDFDDADIGINQPRALHASGPIRSVKVPMHILRGYEGLFARGIERTMGKDPQRTAGGWCRWCKAKEDCKPFKRIANSDAAKAFAGIADRD